jgi:hypothetical protein
VLRLERQGRDSVRQGTGAYPPYEVTRVGSGIDALSGVGSRAIFARRKAGRVGKYMILQQLCKAASRNCESGSGDVIAEAEDPISMAKIPTLMAHKQANTCSKA